MIKNQEDLFKTALEDPRYIIESGFWVVNKDKDVVPFVFNNLQNEFYDQRSEYDDILKASQLGFSTMILAILTVKFLLVPNSWSVCISHEAEATKRLFEKVNFFLTHLPSWLQRYYTPDEESSRELGNKSMRSKFYIGTAGARAFGRGDTIHYAHLSEISRWTDSGRIATGILRAVPQSKKQGDIWIVKETTANGQGNYHHTEWQREKDGASKFMPFFALWLKHEEYRVKNAKIDEWTDEEVYYQKLYPNLFTSETAAFRRNQISILSSEEGYTPEEMFKQEFPLTEEEAFLFSGNPYFPVEQLKEYDTEAEDPILIGNLNGVPPNQVIDETNRGWLKIYEMPEEDGQYIISADTGQFSDRCVATVINKKDWAVVAKFRARIRSNQFGTELNKLGYFYNKALIVIEANNMGQSTVDRLIELNYPQLYMRQRVNKKDKRITNEYGWWTDGKTKPLVLGYLHDLVRTRQAIIPDKDIIGEMKTFVRTEEGKLEASEGNFDDCVIATAIGYFVLKQHPYTKTKTTELKQIVNKVRKFKKLRTVSKRINLRWRR